MTVKGESFQFNQFRVQLQAMEWMNRCVFRADINDGKLLVSERSDRGKEFQTVGAAKEKERREVADLSEGTVRRSLSEERSRRVGVYGVKSE